MEILNEMQRKRYKNMSLLTPSQLVKKYNQPLYIKVRRNRDYLKETEYIKSERRTKRKSSKLKKIQEASSKADKEHKFQMRASRLLSKRIQSKTLIPPKPEKILTPEQLEENKIRKARVIGRLLHITKEELQKIMEIPIKSSQPTLSNPRLSQKSILHQKENLISTKSTKKTLTFQEPHKRRGIGGRHNNEFPSKLEKSKSHKSSRSSSKDRKSFLPAGAIVKRPPSKREREQEEKRKVKILQKITRMFNPDLHLPITTPVPALFHTGCLTCGNPNIKVSLIHHDLLCYAFFSLFFFFFLYLVFLCF
jgi:hypothetical protein